MSVRINIEIGHEASLRTKTTQEGFTHDWEVFVRGCRGSEIENYIEKVVFHLHESFPNPKRVVKEPPFTVKESGYAGFHLPIEVYLKNKDEPKKIKFNYDLNLQASGPPIVKVQTDKYVFDNISDEFKQRLLKGGGSIVSSISSSVKPKKDKTKKKEKKDEKEDKKRKRKSEIKVEDEPEAKVPKEDPAMDRDQAKENDKENQENPEDYMKILRELQHKIMTLQDNSKLQKVVQLIGGTSRFEVSAHTFDFDLCLLERSTVKRLQETFSIPS